MSADRTYSDQDMARSYAMGYRDAAVAALLSIVLLVGILAPFSGAVLRLTCGP